jgi:hypothetical protein
MQLAFDLQEVSSKLLSRLKDEDEANMGPIYSKIFENPTKYI